MSKDEFDKNENEYWTDMTKSAVVPGFLAAALGIILFMASSLIKKEEE